MKRLLLVEDDRSLGATLHERLLREKYDVALSRPNSALRKLEEGNWDLVILDIGLPDGSGFELGRHIKQNTRLPIMFMTASAPPSTDWKALRSAPKNSFQAFYLRELLLRVEHVLERHPVQVAGFLSRTNDRSGGSHHRAADGKRECRRRETLTCRNY
jgi:DNA-binding response OmpR family regulator